MRGRRPGFLSCVLAASLLSICLFARSTAAEMSITKAPRPAEPLLAEVCDPGFPEADCSYHGVYCAPDGKVYFTHSAHSIAVWARLYQYDPKAKAVRPLWTPQSTTPEKGHVAQGKVHSPLAEYKGDLFLCTHTGHYRPDHKLPGSDIEAKPYGGGYVYAVNRETGKGRVVAAPLHKRPLEVPMTKGIVPLGGEALISSVMDTERGLFYALSWPSAILVKVDVSTGKVTEYGKMQDGGEAVARYLPAKPEEPGKQKREPNPRFQRICRTLAMDDEGNVYGSSGDGKIWKYDLKRDEVVIMKSRMQDATRGSMPRAAPYLHLWRTIVWDRKAKVFYGVHWGTSWLFRFDPKADKIEPIMHWAPAKGQVKDYAQIGLAISSDQVLYGFVHAPRLKPKVQRSVHLITLDLKSLRFKDHGNVLSEDGMTLMFAETCAVAPNGDVYTAGWMEIPPERHEEVTQKRRDGGVPEVKYMFVMSLVRIPSERVTLD